MSMYKTPTEAKKLELSLGAPVGMEEAPVYQDMATEGPSEDSDVENQLIDPESWKDGDIVTGKATGAHDEVKGA
ncbi:hypothetical protein KIL84_004727 [Mauremys mutica]|uniref:Uncharacterized protein n=1 Tax=Mauremys mutica TaxID=74926 RepID=A0A9D3XQ83_9SAUR|nr:hypothetical protein KIL84_004727 [Mauremys mutica]